MSDVFNGIDVEFIDSNWDGFFSRQFFFYFVAIGYFFVIVMQTMGTMFGDRNQIEVSVTLLTNILQGDSSALRRGLDCSIVCQIMLGLIRVWQKRLRKRMECPNQSQPGLRTDETTCNLRA